MGLHRRLADRDNGASAVEYALLVAAIAALIIAVVFVIGKFVKAGYQETCNNFDTYGSANIQNAASC